MTYDIKQFAKRIDKSVRTVRRYIADGKAPNGIDWKPKKEKGKYTFTDKDVNIWQSESHEDNESDMTGQSLILNANHFFTEMRSITSELSEVKALTARANSLSNDYEKIKGQYIEAMAKIKQLEIENARLKENIEKLKNRNFINRILDR